MATDFHLFFARGGAGEARRAAAEAFSELDRLEGELSRFVPTSDVSRIGSLSRGETLRLGADAFACLKMAEEVRGLSGGAFDPLAASGRPLGGRPRPFCLDRPARSVTVARRTSVDLGGIGKGYALDVMAAVLEEWGAGPVLLDAGQSTVRTAGGRGDSPRWTVRLRHPDGGERTAGVARIGRGAVSGSGAVVGGRHIVDPRTGRRIAARRAAWAAAESAAYADAFSTVFFVLGDAGIRRACERAPGVTAVVARRTARGWRMRESGGTEGVDLEVRLRDHKRVPESKEACPGER